MSTESIVYGSPVTITIGLASLASFDNNDAAAIGRQSAVIDNTSNLMLDAILGGQIKTGTATQENGLIQVFLFGSYDGTSFTSGLGGGDANSAVISTPERSGILRLAYQSAVDVIGSVITWKFGPISVARAFDGCMPQKWGVFVFNNTGDNLDATSANHFLKYTPIKYASA